MDKLTGDAYDLDRYVGTTRPADAAIDTVGGKVKLQFFEVKEEYIDKELQHQAADFIFFSNQEVLYETKLRNLENEITTLKGSLWKVIIKENPSFRVKDIEVSIEADQDMSDLRQKHSEVDHTHRQWVVIRKAFEMKARMIQSFVGLKRSRIERQIEQNRGYRTPNN